MAPLCQLFLGSGLTYELLIIDAWNGLHAATLCVGALIRFLSGRRSKERPSTTLKPALIASLRAVNSRRRRAARG